MIPYEKAAGINATKQLIGSVSFGQSVGIFIGPEGGFEAVSYKHLDVYKRQDRV